MIQVLVGVGVFLVLGYVIAKYHSRARTFGARVALGAVAGEDVPALPTVSDVHGRADETRSDSTDATGHGEGGWGTEGDSGSDADSSSAAGDSDS